MQELKKLSLLAALLLLEGCQTLLSGTKPPIDMGAVCTTFDVFAVSNLDTSMTRAAALEHNAKYCCMCPDMYPDKCEKLLDDIQVDCR